MKFWRSGYRVPVSYTHLDVYKRQLYYISKAGANAIDYAYFIFNYRKAKTISRGGGGGAEFFRSPFGERKNPAAARKRCLLYTSRCV